MNISKLKDQNPRIKKNKISIIQKKIFDKFFNKYKEQSWYYWSRISAERCLKYFPDLVDKLKK